MRRKGFTLVEIMIVVAIIALLAAIAIPNLLRARVNAQESAAASAMHTITSAQVSWRATNSTYATLAQLGAATPPYIDSTLAGGSKQSYTFAIPQQTASQFYATAVPQTLAQAHSFYIDEGGILCRSDAVGTAAAGGHTAAGTNCPAGYSEVQ